MVVEFNIGRNNLGWWACRQNDMKYLHVDGTFQVSALWDGYHKDINFLVSMVELIHCNDNLRININRERVEHGSVQRG